MRLKLRHFLHPVRTVRAARQRMSERAELMQVIAQGERRFRHDPRYSLAAAEQGTSSRPMTDSAADHAADDALLRRICHAYSKAVARQPAVPGAFRANRWWQLVQEASLGPVTAALASRDLAVLRRMYRNFFRDPCGAGITRLPGVALRASVDSYKRLLLIDALHRQDLWNRKVAGRYSTADLETTNIGNPIGVVFDGRFIRTGAEEQHYYAERLAELAPQPAPVIAEVGGGFGGVAEFLLRGRAGITYIGFDVPETIALASWYLLKAFPGLKATLYGEGDLSIETLHCSDIVLMPAFALQDLGAACVDVSFAQHVFSDMSTPYLHQYLDEIVRTTRRHILQVNRYEASQAASDYLERRASHFTLRTREPAEWNSARTLRNDEQECLYSAGSASEVPPASAKDFG